MTTKAKSKRSVIDRKRAKQPEDKNPRAAGKPVAKPVGPPRACKIVELPIDDHLLLSDETQARAGIYVDFVDDYAEAMLAGDVFPPIVVFEEVHALAHARARMPSTYYVGDGWHRLRAAIKIGQKTITAEVKSGGLDGLASAILHAAGANTEHGIRRSRQDRRRAVMLLLSRVAWRSRSDRWIAEVCKVDHKTVASVRAEWQAKHDRLGELGISPADLEAAHNEKRQGKDGKRRAAGAPAVERLRAEAERLKQREESEREKRKQQKERRRQRVEHERAEYERWRDEEAQREAEEEARLAETSKIAGLIERAAHPATPEEEARTSAVQACRLIMKHGLLGLLRGAR